MKKETVNIETVQLGRPVNPNSVRQQRLAELEEKRNNGELKRGRPVNGESERQKRLAEMEAKRANGELKRGRPAMVKKEVEIEAVLEIMASK